MHKKYIDIYRKGAVWELSQAIQQNLEFASPNSKTVILCIGTDRSTGDSLGPLVGYRLKQYYSLNAEVYGNLENPVHAKNLEETIIKIENQFPNSFTIAIDASLGSYNNVGQISVGKGPIKPGSGLKKQLPETGDMHITGIVNYCGWMDFMILQNTRLSLVMKMAETIASGLQFALWKNNSATINTQSISIK